MDIQKLKYFYSVAKLEHITKAAEELHISQPSLSQAIHQLEEELQVPLFKKIGRRITLTDVGKFLKARLDTLLPEFDNLPIELAKLKETSSKTIKLNILAASTFVINCIIKYKKNNPDVIFDFEQNELKLDCDIVITTNLSNNNTTSQDVTHFIKQEKIFLAVPKSSIYSQQESINLQDVKNENFIMLSNSRLFGAICNKFCSLAGFSPKILFESDSPAAVQNIISMGAGISFWPELSWGKNNNKNVMLVPINFPICQRNLIIELHKRLPQSKYALEFYNFLLKQI